MKESYISLETLPRRKSAYQSSKSYICEDDMQQSTLTYTLLPEEYSVFSEIDPTYFLLDDTEQHSFLASCLLYLKAQLLNIYTKVGVICIFPKISISMESDGAITLNWAYANFRIYFNFEPLVDNSFYGMVAQSVDENIFTNVGKLNKKNFHAVIDSLLEYVVSVL